MFTIETATTMTATFEDYKEALLVFSALGRIYAENEISNRLTLVDENGVIITETKIYTGDNT